MLLDKPKQMFSGAFAKLIAADFKFSSSPRLVAYWVFRAQFILMFFFKSFHYTKFSYHAGVS